ncbi:MAG: nascent polypeptide-associated complex protein [Thermoplasmata archaeon]|nr:MAG: nascent polypeptide-associated complex protein [Thermoplasmata archaeon]KAA0010146.1 MAG: nascent polypeptide-associated complex protein [Thermoplasmata archaeon]OYT59792.1 MAG: nascent polypeptide-associated complex protein [Thermoplasmatales archaeon ex4484_30]
MIPLDDKQLRLAMKKLGMNIREIKAEKVIIETPEKDYVFENPVVSVIEMKGQKMYQITGEPKICMKLSEEDIELVAEKTGRSKEEARKALEEAKGDIAQAIINLTS